MNIVWLYDQTNFNLKNKFINIYNCAELSYCNIKYNKNNNKNYNNNYNKLSEYLQKKKKKKKENLYKKKFKKNYRKSLKWIHIWNDP